MTKHRLKTSPFWAIAVVAALGMGLSACGSSDDDTAEAPTVTEPTGPTQAELDAAEAAREKAEMERDAAQAELDAAKAKEDLATARALLAVLDEAPTFPDAEGSGTTTPSIAVTVSYGMDGAGAKIAASRDGTNADTSRLDPGFSASGEMADPISGWAGLMFGREDKGKAGSGSMVVYTNIEASGSKPFAEMYGEDLTVTFPDDGSDGTPAKAFAEDFAEKGSKVHTDTEFRGTYDGAAGTYKCVAGATGCTSSRSSDLKLVLSADWTFKADSGATVSVADTDHLHFGWWVRRDADGDPAWVDTFAGGMNPVTDTAAIGAIQGAATYKGGAAGKYAMRSLGGTTGGGHWTAMSELTAKFGGAGADNGSVSGKIYGFLAGGKEMPWEVTLGNDADIGAANGNLTGNTTALTAGATTWKIEREAATSGGGTWSGNFYNASTGTEGQPSGIAGTFNAHFGADEDDHAGRMTGAFGATRQ